jgi:hypothetical protein
MNERHPIRHFFTNRRIQDAMNVDFHEDKFGELGVDTRKVETAPSYNRAPWMIDAYKCLDFTMCRITKKASRERIVAECTATLGGEYNERLKIFTDGFLKDETVGYTIVTPETTIKN